MERLVEEVEQPGALHGRSHLGFRPAPSSLARTPENRAPRAQLYCAGPDGEEFEVMWMWMLPREERAEPSHRTGAGTA